MCHLACHLLHSNGPTFLKHLCPHPLHVILNLCEMAVSTPLTCSKLVADANQGTSFYVSALKGHDSTQKWHACRTSGVCVRQR